MKINEIKRAIEELRELQSLIDPTEAGGNARWNALQSWIDNHPTWRPLIDAAVKLPPDQALASLAAGIGLDLSLLRPFDPSGEIIRKAVATMAELQTLYTERSQLS